jgi:hypothetical protein
MPQRVNRPMVWNSENFVHQLTVVFSVLPINRSKWHGKGMVMMCSEMNLEGRIVSAHLIDFLGAAGIFWYTYSISSPNIIQESWRRRGRWKGCMPLGGRPWSRWCSIMGFGRWPIRGNRGNGAQKSDDKPVRMSVPGGERRKRRKRLAFSVMHWWSTVPFPRHCDTSFAGEHLLVPLFSWERTVGKSSIYSVLSDYHQQVPRECKAIAAAIFNGTSRLLTADSSSKTVDHEINKHILDDRQVFH